MGGSETGVGAIGDVPYPEKAQSGNSFFYGLRETRTKLPREFAHIL